MELGFTYYQANNSVIQNLLARVAFKREVIRLTRKHKIEGFTLLKALGAWQGKTEPPFQMLLVGVDKATVKALANDFKERFQQDSVMIKDGKRVEFI